MINPPGGVIIDNNNNVNIKFNVKILYICIFIYIMYYAGSSGDTINKKKRFDFDVMMQDDTIIFEMYDVMSNGYALNKDLLIEFQTLKNKYIGTPNKQTIVNQMCLRQPYIRITTQGLSILLNYIAYKHYCYPLDNSVWTYIEHSGRGSTELYYICEVKHNIQYKWFDVENFDKHEQSFNSFFHIRPTYDFRQQKTYGINY
jgi:hypothetical protein